MIRGILQRPRALVLACLLAAPLACAAGSEGDRIRVLEEKLEQSLRLIEALQRKVDALEASSGGSGEARLQRLEDRVEETAAGQGARDPGMPLHGFADVVGAYASGDSDAHDHPGKGFAVGNLDLYLTPDLGGKVRSLVELVFEMEDSGESVAEIERAQLGYAFSDALTVWAGRYHNPFGYWNTAYHHGAQLQTSITRPQFLEFEDHGGLIPMHGIGVWATGRLAVGGDRLAYDAYMANSPSVDDEGTLDVHAAGRDEFHAMAGLSLAWRPATVAGLQLGVHALQGRVELPSDSTTRLQMIGGYASFDDGRWEGLAELYRFANRSSGAADGRYTSTAWFAQLAYRADHDLSPFARFERASLDRDDPYFGALRDGQSYRRLALGLRFDLTAQAALKLELARKVTELEPSGTDHDNQAFVQYAVRF